MAASMDMQRPMFNKMRQRLNELYEQRNRLVKKFNVNTRKQLELVGSMPTEELGNREAFLETKKTLEDLYDKLILERSDLIKKRNELKEQDELLRLDEFAKPDIEFAKENESLCKLFGTLQSYVDSKHFLDIHPTLVCDKAARFLIEWGLRLEMPEQSELIKCVAHQSVCLQYILELGEQLDTSPVKCRSRFFQNVQNSSLNYRTQFLKDVNILTDYINRWASCQPKTQKPCNDLTLDPFEVIDNLPDEIRICFVQQNTDLLKHILLDSPCAETLYHLKRCIQIGIWDPKGNIEQSVRNDGHPVHESPEKKLEAHRSNINNWFREGFELARPKTDRPPVHIQMKQQQHQQQVGEKKLIRKCNKEVQTSSNIFLSPQLDLLSNQKELKETYEAIKKANLNKSLIEQNICVNQTNTNDRSRSNESVLQSTESSHNQMREDELKETFSTRYQFRFGYDL